MASMNGRLTIGQQSRQCTYTIPKHISPKPTALWQLGDIAFLKRETEFNKAERTEFLQTGRIYARATGHPVIILDHSSDSRYYIVTTVSAYSSDERNNYLPPWKQRVHAYKDINGFRAFEGSAKPNNNYKHLRLADNAVWPKTKTSWVYVHQPYLVPASALINYNKPRSQLRMAPESLQDLLSHMETRSRALRDRKAEMHGIQTIPSQLRVTKNHQGSWRRDDKKQAASQPLAIRNYQENKKWNNKENWPPLRSYADVVATNINMAAKIPSLVLNQCAV